jgi:hypothetical protein
MAAVSGAGWQRGQTWRSRAERVESKTAGGVSRGNSYLWLPSLGLPGFRCASVAALPAVLIFSCLPGLETAFRALEEEAAVAAVDIEEDAE